MSLNIKHPEAHKLAQELARETNETMTEAVTEALRERLERVRRRRKPDMKTADLLAIGRRCASKRESHAGKRLESLRHGMLLYDKQGLPQ
jgi:antitoxin VapB